MAFDQAEYLATLSGPPPANVEARLSSMKGEMEKVKNLAPSGDNPPRVDNPPPVDNPDVLLGLPTAWWLNVKGYNPAAEAKRLGLPMLVLQGERDFQVTMKD